MTGWLADLRDKAGKAIGDSIDRGWYIPDSLALDGLSDVDAEFIAACSPERVRALCEAAYALEDVLDGWKRERGGNPLDPEEFYARRDYAQVKLAALASLEPARKDEGT